MMDHELDSIIDDYWDNPSEYTVPSDLTDDDLRYIVGFIPSSACDPFTDELKQCNLPTMNVNELRLLGQQMLDIPMYKRYSGNIPCMELGQNMEEKSWTVLAKSLATL